MYRPSTELECDKPKVRCKKTLIIFTQGRTGSSWLSIGLYRLGIGVPMEYFNPNKMSSFHERGISIYRDSDEDIESYIMKLYDIRTTSNGIFAVKIHIKQWIDLWVLKSNSLYRDRETYLKKLLDVFENPHFVFLYREDIASQVISTHIALQTSSWSSDVEKKKPAEYSFEQILNIYFLINDQIKRTRSIEQGIDAPKMVMTYEDLHRDYDGCLQSIIDFMGEDTIVTPNVHEENLSKQGSTQNKIWKRRFIRDLKIYEEKAL